MQGSGAMSVVQHLLIAILAPVCGLDGLLGEGDSALDLAARQRDLGEASRVDRRRPPALLSPALHQGSAQEPRRLVEATEGAQAEGRLGEQPALVGLVRPLTQRLPGAS